MWWPVFGILQFVYHTSKTNFFPDQSSTGQLPLLKYNTAQNYRVAIQYLQVENKIMYRLRLPKILLLPLSFYRIEFTL